jgi:hypothetical protein
LKNNFFDESLDEEQIFDDVNHENVLETYETAKSNALENCNTLIIFDDVQKFF